MVSDFSQPVNDEIYSSNSLHLQHLFCRQVINYFLRAPADCDGFRKLIKR